MFMSWLIALVDDDYNTTDHCGLWNDLPFFKQTFSGQTAATKGNIPNNSNNTGLQLVVILIHNDIINS